ncbi:MAG: hydroxyethylthiazole kinase [Dongiaceae bacterium]
MTDRDVWRTLSAARAARPLVHNITNYVVMNSTANALLAFGASPAMAHAAEEVEEFVDLAQALVVNIGTLSPPWVAAMKLAASRAAACGRPWVLDPVGAGATTYRSAVAGDLAGRKPAVIRGNASEILSLAGAAADATRGVDSTQAAEAALEAARALARRTGAVVAVTGAVDYVTDGERTAACHNGHPLMTRVTGMGCTASALVGACLAVEPDPLTAALHGLAILGVAGELAAEHASGPGTLQVDLYDVLANLDRETLERRVRLQ